MSNAQLTEVDGGVVLALRNDLQRFGVDRVLHQIGIVDSMITHHHDLGYAIRAVPEGDTRLLIGALAEVDQDVLALLRGTVDRRVQVLLLVDVDRPGPLATVGALADLPTVGFLDLGELSAATLGAALKAARDEMPISPRLARTLLSAVHRAPEPRRPRLTPREQQTLQLLIGGLSNRQIARRLGISEHGAKRHVANLLGKLDCANRTQAVALALRVGLCDPPAAEDAALA